MSETEPVSWELDDKQGPEAPPPFWEKGLGNSNPIISTDEVGMELGGRLEESGGSHRGFSRPG